MTTCEVCNGGGVVEVMVPVCCENPRESGECCGNPVAGYDLEACATCGGIGHYPDERLERAP